MIVVNGGAQRGTGAYGALELKQCYRANLAAGLAAAGLLHLAVVAAFLLFGSEARAPAPPRTVPGGDAGVLEWRRQPEFRNDPGPIVGGAPPAAVPTALKGIPRPMPDAEVTTDVEYVTPFQRGTRAGTQPGGPGEGEGLAIVTDVELPPPTAVVFCTEQPVLLREQPAVYPPFALANGLEGTVDLRILIDTRGHVVDAFVIRCSATRLGFEEAALEAVRGRLYRPAIQNDHPVAVWVNIPVRFEIR